MKNHIKNLDTFRAIAAMVVAVGHIELFRQNNFGNSVVDYVPSGHIGVILFFCDIWFPNYFFAVERKRRVRLYFAKRFLAEKDI